MKRWILRGTIPLLVWLIFLLVMPARADDVPLMAEPEIGAALSEACRTEKGIRLSLQYRNRMETEQNLLILIPKTDGMDTVFDSGWPSEEIVLPPGKDVSAELTILLAEGQDSFQSVSFRFAFGNHLSSETVIFPETPGKNIPASLSAKEPQIVNQEVQADFSERPAPLVITDQVEKTKRALLDYGQAWVCLGADGTLIPFCAIPLRVDDAGRAEGRYSGLAVCLENRKEQPLEVREEWEDERLRIQTSEISMTGESVFFATLKLDIQETEEGFRLSRQTINSAELGGKYDQAPMGLLDTAEPLLKVMENNEAPVETIDVQTMQQPLDQPLTVHLYPAEEMGEIWIYCEYFFFDGTDIVHPPYKVTEYADEGA